MLPSQPKRLATGGEQFHVKAGSEHLRKLMGSIQHMLEVVEHEQHARPAQRVDQRLPHRLARRVLDACRTRDRWHNESASRSTDRSTN